MPKNRMPNVRYAANPLDYRKMIIPRSFQKDCLEAADVPYALTRLPPEFCRPAARYPWSPCCCWLQHPLQTSLSRPLQDQELYGLLDRLLHHLARLFRRTWTLAPASHRRVFCPPLQKKPRSAATTWLGLTPGRRPYARCQRERAPPPPSGFSTKQTGPALDLISL
eukprot:COSAG02_NODE_1578_length_11853_cov_3.734048_8_plen_166_part_00